MNCGLNIVGQVDLPANVVSLDCVGKPCIPSQVIRAPKQYLNGPSLYNLGFDTENLVTFLNESFVVFLFSIVMHLYCISVISFLDFGMLDHISLHLCIYMCLAFD